MFGTVSSYFALGLILFYRRWLSPLKRGRCASGHVLGPGHSCSDVGLRVFGGRPFAQAVIAMREQLALCREFRFGLIASGNSGGTPEVLQPCCELLYEIGDALTSLARAVGLVYGAWCVVKYSIGATNLMGGMDIASQGVFAITGASLYGAAASSYWVVFVIAVIVDVFLVGALLTGANALPFIVGQFALAFYVLHIEEYVQLANGNIYSAPYILASWWPSDWWSQASAPRIPKPPGVAKMFNMLSAAFAFKMWVFASLILIVASIFSRGRR